MQTQASLHGTPARSATGRGLGPGIVRVLELVDTWLGRRRQRLDLGRLDDRMLKDLGLTRADVAREAGKPFWRA
jgi:uncharacterized protein YjiS (DUF1127 family)